MSPTARQSLAAASPNFGFLEPYGARLLQAATAGERYVFDDPVSALMRLRQFGELLAEEAAALVGIYKGAGESQVDLLRRLADRGVLTRDVADLFHDLRRQGNAAAHDAAGSPREALHQLRMARKLAVWFHRGLGGQPGFKEGPFLPPPDPSRADALLKAELERLRSAVTEAQAAAKSGSAAAKREAALRAEAEEAAKRAYRDLEAAVDLARETEEQATAERLAWQQRLNQQQTKAEATPRTELEAIVLSAQVAGDAEKLDLDEAATRKKIDRQLCDAGWEADTTALNYKQGVRPIKGRNMAIAEWPTASGPADYVLFVGLMPVAVVEAKRERKDVAGAIQQAKRYSRDYALQGDEVAPGGPWREYTIPFLFATNGRDYLRQIRTKSGIWFLDARRSTNHADALDGWYTPEGLRGLLQQDHDKAEAALETEPTDYLGLREYQLDAIRAAEAAIAAGKRELLLAMATGTGKTRTALGLLYRLIKSKRFRRVLFLVDRTALGEQAENAFKNVKLENLQSLNQIYDVKSMGDIVPDEDTRLHIATVQGMVQRLLGAEDGKEPPVDRYDCIIVDESHRGYTLDKDMTEGEMAFRSETEYVSKYRRVLDHFDAVRIGLTATPALHTSEIFGKPVYQYTYRQAVIDGFLVDHAPPVAIKTALNQSGIHWSAGEEIAIYRKKGAQLDLYNAPDDIDIDVEGFNTKVVTENFNRVVCGYLAKEIDPNLPGKTMVFCATDSHADMVVVLLKEAFREVYGEVEDDAVMKITGNSDKPLHLIRLFKNEALPKVAVTVDLLTTGIDVPEITTLVFLRRVRSRILYEQMIGRATRLCPSIGKEFFQIYDPVGLYEALEDYTTMKPVVTRAKVTFAQLAEELGTVADDQHCGAAADELLVKFHRRKARLTGDKLSSFETLTGMDPSGFVGMLKERDLAQLRPFFKARPLLGAFLDGLKPTGDGGAVLVSDHADEFVGTERGYGEASKPEDYLEGFRAYLAQNGNRLPALMVVTQRPRDLTRQQLRELSLELDAAGYSLSHLRTAWRDLTNEDIAASLIGFIRGQALGSPLLPYEERVNRALKKLLASQAWTPPQRKWLERIANQVKLETVVDKSALDRGQFQAEGGFNRLNKVFDGKLEEVLGDLHQELWSDAG